MQSLGSHPAATLIAAAPAMAKVLSLVYTCRPCPRKYGGIMLGGEARARAAAVERGICIAYIMGGGGGVFPVVLSPWRGLRSVRPPLMQPTGQVLTSQTARAPADLAQGFEGISKRA